MDQTIYFADKSVTFTAKEPSEPCFVLHLAADERVYKAKILKILEIQNFIFVVAPDIAAVFAAFAAEFVAVEAAGGVTVNSRGEWLMIHRNGRWDLPKGHLEEGETLDQCAAREVSEETGVQGAQVVRHLCNTLHGYLLRGVWELKCTHWYELRTASLAPLTPQSEEGIDVACWCSPACVAANLVDAFPTIRQVAARMR
ncbi:MAG: NUDIX domain-containing protein [Alistipes sp.]